MNIVSSAPYISPVEFETACKEFSESFAAQGENQSAWLSVEYVQSRQGNYLRISKRLRTFSKPKDNLASDEEEIEEEEDDEVVLSVDTSPRAVVEYDITLSTSYQVPVLYFRIKDPSFRYPPNMATLYGNLIAGQFKSQAEHAGVIGGITITDHPYTGTTAYFIHPCQTASVLEASISSERISPYQYLILWIGAICSCVSLNIPLELMVDQDRKPASLPS